MPRAKRTRQPRPRKAETLILSAPPGAYSISSFCQAHDLSEDMFFKMQRAGWGPVTMKVGARTLVSIESAATWRRQREAETAAAKAAASAPPQPDAA
jgi:hypothetical protein